MLFCRRRQIVLTTHKAPEGVLLHHLLQGVRLQQLEAAAVSVDEPLLLHGAQLPGKGAAVAVEVIRQLDAGEGDLKVRLWARAASLSR